jgi:hypothetical protein
MPRYEFKGDYDLKRFSADLEGRATILRREANLFIARAEMLEEMASLLRISLVEVKNQTDG